MNLYKIVLDVKNLSVVSKCRYSVVSSLNLDRKYNFEKTSDRHLFSNTFSQNNVYKRNFSIDGIVKWQEQFYNNIANSASVNYVQDALLYFHDTTGLTWSATIVSTTVLVRLLMTFPLSVYQGFILAKVENVSMELKDIVNELKKEAALAKKMYNLSDKKTLILFRRSMKKQWRKLIERDNCHPLKTTLVIWFQIPIWVCMSFALRNLVNMNSPDASALITFMELQAGGFGWIPNLTVPDQSFILPVVFGLTNLANIEVQRMSKLREPSKLYNIFTNIFRVFSIAMIPIAGNVPSCMCLYWTTSSIFGLAQNLCLLSPSLRRKLGIPEAPSELQNPYSHMKEEIKIKLSKTPIIASIYTSGRDEQNFSKAHLFLPYRWDRNNPERESLINHVPSASLPFAMGARSCIGKKIAMLQLMEIISQIAQNFDFECTNKENINSITSQVLIPDKSIEFLFTNRHKEN